MGKTNETSEVQVLHFFENGPLEKAEVLFNIVAEKMRERLAGQGVEAHATPKQTSVTRKRREPPGVPAPGLGDTPPQDHVA